MVSRAKVSGFWHTLLMSREREQEVREDEAHGAKSEAEHEEIRPREIGGPKGPEPTRFGDWERRGRCIDF
jgi:hypothetical protein